MLQRFYDNELYVSSRNVSSWKKRSTSLAYSLVRIALRWTLKRWRYWRTGRNRDQLLRHGVFGQMQFFRTFIPKSAKIATPLTDLTNKGLEGHKWNGSCDKALKSLKSAIIQSSVLIFSSWEKPFRRHVDASQFAVRGKLTKLDENRRDQVILFFCKKLFPTEQNSNANDRDYLALLKFLERLKCYLERCNFGIITDNQVIKRFSGNQRWTGRRWHGWKRKKTSQYYL